MCVIVQQSHQNLFRRVCSTNQSSVNQTVFSNHIITASQVPSQGFPGGSAGKEPTCNVRDLGLIPGLGRSPGEGKGYPLHILAWRTGQTAQATGSQGVGHDRAAFSFASQPGCSKPVTVSEQPHSSQGQFHSVFRALQLLKKNLRKNVILLVTVKGFYNYTL